MNREAWEPKNPLDNCANRHERRKLQAEERQAVGRQRKARNERKPGKRKPK